MSRISPKHTAKLKIKAPIGMSSVRSKTVVNSKIIEKLYHFNFLKCNITVITTKTRLKTSEI